MQKRSIIRENEPCWLRTFVAGMIFLGLLLSPSARAAHAEFSAEFSPEMTLLGETPLDACSEMPNEMTAALAPENAGPSGITARLIPWPAPKRMFGVLPNYRAAQAQADYTPLTTRQKYGIARKDSFDWPNFPLLAGYALQSQIAAGGFSHNGGFPGFAKFYGRAMGDAVIGNYLTEALLPGLLHEDPRFFRLGSGSLLRRAGRAALGIAVTRSDTGRNRLNVSELAGNAGVIAITSFYYPESQSAGDGLERYAMNLGNDVISNLLTEFWPDVKRKLQGLRKRRSAIY